MVNLRLVATFVSLSCLASGAEAGQDVKLVIKRADVLAKSGKVEPRNLALRQCGPGTPAEIRQPVSNEAGPARVRLTFTGALPKDGWSIAVVSDDSGERWTLPAAAAASRPRQQPAAGGSVGDLIVWSGAVRGGAKSVVLTRERPDAQCPSVRISGLLIDAIQSSPSSITPPDDLWEWEKARPKGPAAMSAWATAIARIRYVSDEDGLGYFCTGFLVTPRLLLTNEHCLSNQTEALTAELDFDFDGGSAQAQTVRVKSLVQADVDLDYALAEIEAALPRTPLTLAVSAFDQTPDMIVVQHPSGKIKHVSITGCTMARNDVPGVSDRRTDFEHRCDTEGGSSGSPVHHVATGNVVGLHHFGFPVGATRGRNQAVKIVDILAHLNQQLPAISKTHPHLAAEIKAFVDGALARR